MAGMCPNDGTPLKDLPFKGVMLDACPTCAGIWFDAEDLRAVLAADPEGAAEVDAEVRPQIEQKAGPPSARRCPRDAQVLQEQHYLYNSPVVLESCPQCSGFWVEDGELTKMQQLLDAQLAAPTPDEQKKLALAQDAFQHQQFLVKLQHLNTLTWMLRRNSTGWIGLLP